jgi:hypothetical protein
MSAAPIAPWRFGNGSDDVVADHPTGHDDPAIVAHYGGHLVAESIPPQYRALIKAAPDLLTELQKLLAAYRALAKLGHSEDDAYTVGPHNAIAKATGETA